MTTHCCSVGFQVGGRHAALGFFCSILIGSILLLGVPSPAWAGAPGFYSGGVFHPLVVSETEFVVEFSDPADRPVFTQRMKVSAGATLEDVPWGNHRGLAILRLAEDSPAARLRARKMVRPEAGSREQLHRVYRFTPGALPVLSTGNIVVRFRADVDDTVLSQILDDYRLELVRPVAGLAHTYVVRPTGAAADDAELDTANALYRDDRTVYAHPDLRFPLATRQAGDTFFGQQWHLDNTGQNGATAGEDIDIFGAFARTEGTTTKVGQLDDACDVEHEDFVANYLGISHDISDNSQSATAANPQVEGDRHGTATMGLMVSAINGLGVVGVAPSAQFTASRGLSDTVSTSQIASAYTFARNLNVDVHNNSWGFAAGTPNPDVIVNAIETAFTEGRDGLGMVICFASGNGGGMEEGAPEGVEVSAPEELATLDTVIGVGASNAAGEIASYSNFGKEIDVLAPSNDFPSGGSALPAIVTTDNRDGVFTDSSGSALNGYNNGGFDDNGGINLADANYTNNFGGTSAAAPQVTGLAALILALEPNYTATQVRNVIEHTCDKINPDVANYNDITSRSLRYGYGRINAGTAVEATFDGFFWPERVANVTVDNNTIFWKFNDDLREIGAEQFGVETQTVLVVQSDSPITTWQPVDGQIYAEGDIVAPDVTVVANLKAEQYSFGTPTGTQYFGVYSVANTPRRGATYGFGVSVTSQGAVIDSGTVADNGSGGNLPPSKPRVSIEVTPLSGLSPLEVSFVGNAQSDNDIPDGGFVWDFGDGVTSTDRVTTHTYTVSSGTRRFFPRLTVTDALGQTGSRSVAVDVTAPDTGGGGAGETGGSVTIRISDPASLTSDISSGTAPLSVVLSAELTGSLGDSSDLTVFWDLGDGNTENSLSVAHTYQIAGTFPVSVTINSSSLAAPLQATRFLQVLPDTTLPTPTPTPTPNPGTGGSTPCGATPVAAFVVMGLFVMLRKLTR